METLIRSVLCKEVLVLEHIIIRPATEADAEEMLALYAPYVLHTTVTSEYAPPTLEEFRERIRSYMAKTPWLCCVIDGQIAGYGYASPHRKRAGYQWSCETSIYTRMGFHRRGIASALYQSLFDILTYQGYYSIYVGITSPNPRSMAFHMAMGFSRMGAYHRSMYKFGKWRDVIWMGKSLRHHVGTPEPITPYPQIQDDAYCVQVLQERVKLIHEPQSVQVSHG